MLVHRTRSRSILDYFPYEGIREVQREILLALEAEWDRYDVFAIVLPTAGGKTAIARTIMDWQAENGVIYTMPTNQLLQQFTDTFPDSETVRRKAHYQCHDIPGVPCSEKAVRCPDCPMLHAQRLESAIKPVACTPHTMMLRKLWENRDVVVMDEAHTVIPMIQDLAARVTWKHKARYPDNWRSIESLQRWWSSYIGRKRESGKKQSRNDKKYDQLIEQTIMTDKPVYACTEEERPWRNGAGWLKPPVPRGEEVDLPALVWKPIDIRNLPEVHRVLPHNIRKLVLMSATFSTIDIDQLGLSRRRVLYIQCKSPIPPERRPIVIPEDILPVTYKSMREATEYIADYLRNGILPSHEGEKGIIHASYAQARMLKQFLGTMDGRILYHDADDKLDVLQEFLNSPPDSGKALVASGMHEGVDLPYDLARWQVVAKIPWKSLANPAIKYKSESEPDWYIWETLKYLIQACGRVARTPEDYGVTYILDKTFWRLYNQGKHLAPSWWLDAIHPLDGE
jgi:Rad3-related DNA helicase